ncbi:hypothetical protein AVEN_73906-1 [Araneus ventricosus]|uniref:Integrase p58-like C-terminal domain-containing protein n=1 Tax=Araneus ventricosus TaxID=182803 RepID=A0A4Y2JKD0_ARAVE|nr:hypothetical protein AVEN_73906-1 [Araneus ventricosus]
MHLFCPNPKPGLSRKFCKPNRGKYIVTRKFSDVVYEIQFKSWPSYKQIVNIDRLSKAVTRLIYDDDQNYKVSGKCIHEPEGPSQNADLPVVPERDKFRSYLRSLRATALTQPATSTSSPINNLTGSQNSTATASGSKQNRYYLRERQDDRVVKK